MPNRQAQATKREIATQRAFGRSRKPRKIIPRQTRPSAIERDYARALVRVAVDTKQALKPLLAELPALLRSARAEILRVDCGPLRHDAGEAKRARDLIAQSLASVQLPDPAISGLAETFADRTAVHQRGQMARQTRAALGVDVFAGDGNLAAAREVFVAENAQLIKSLPAKTIEEIEGIVLRGASSGTLHKDVAKEIAARFNVQKSRAKLIARDQIGKYYAKVNSTRHRAMGIEEFIWRTVGDERVRDEHQSINGRKFRYPDGAPGEGLPGEPILCRCFADPVFDALL